DRQRTARPAVRRQSAPPTSDPLSPLPSTPHPRPGPWWPAQKRQQTTPKLSKIESYPTPRSKNMEQETPAAPAAQRFVIVQENWREGQLSRLRHIFRKLIRCKEHSMKDRLITIFLSVAATY